MTNEGPVPSEADWDATIARAAPGVQRHMARVLKAVSGPLRKLSEELETEGATIPEVCEAQTQAFAIAMSYFVALYPSDLRRAVIENIADGFYQALVNASVHADSALEHALAAMSRSGGSPLHDAFVASGFQHIGGVAGIDVYIGDEPMIVHHQPDHTGVCQVCGHTNRTHPDPQCPGPAAPEAA
jgi:hypothetical protein